MDFSSGGSTPIDIRVNDVYQDITGQMVRLSGLVGDVRINLGSVKLSDILNCRRIYI